MRDVHRMKEKYDLSFDNRQIVSLLIGGIVVLGAVFVLGVVVGKKLATDERTADAPDLLAALDAQAAETRQPAALTFQDELTRKEEPAREPALPEKAPPEPRKETKEPAVLAEESAPTPIAEPSGTDEPVPTRTREGAMQQAIARAQRPAEAAPNGAFTLQLSASQDRPEADRFAGRLRDRGYAPYVLEVEVPGRGTWYRVRMGSFSTREAATRYLQDFRRETQLDAFVAPSN